MTAISAAALMGLAGGVAHADPRKPIEMTIRDDTPALAPLGAKMLQWDARRGRWGLTFNVDRRDSRAMQLNDVQAGAYFRITPSLRVGGAVALGDATTDAFRRAQPRPQDGQPRVRLETALKF